jgi:hypothetical protein
MKQRASISNKQLIKTTKIFSLLSKEMWVISDMIRRDFSQNALFTCSASAESDFRSLIKLSRVMTRCLVSFAKLNFVLKLEIGRDDSNKISIIAMPDSSSSQSVGRSSVKPGGSGSKNG